MTSIKIKLNENQWEIKNTNNLRYSEIDCLNKYSSKLYNQ